MSKIGVGWVLRKAGGAASSTTTVSQEGEDVRVKSESTVKSSNNLYPIGKAVSETTMDGRTVESTAAWKDGEFMKTETWKGKTATIKYVVSGTTMTQVIDFQLTILGSRSQASITIFHQNYVILFVKWNDNVATLNGIFGTLAHASDLNVCSCAHYIGPKIRSLRSPTRARVGYLIFNLTPELGVLATNS